MALPLSLPLRFRLKIALTAVTFLTAGCAAGPDYTPPVPPEVSGYTSEPTIEQTASADAEGGDAQTFKGDPSIPAKWWELFHSPGLNALVEEAIRNNPDLASAQAALHEAQENYYAGTGAFFPTVFLSAGPEWQKVSEYRLGNPPRPPGTPFLLYNASVNVSYAPDIFGGTRRETESLEAMADYQRFELEAAYLSLTANVVTTAAQVAALQEEVAETERAIGVRNKQLGIMNEQMKGGVLTQASVLQQQAVLAQARASLPYLRKQLAQQRDLLTILTGHYPGEGRLAVPSLAEIHLPKDLPLSLPSQLVAQRPDVRAAEQLMRAANAQVGVATADMLPHITLGGSFGSVATTIGSMFSPASLAWNLAASLMQPVFEGGKLMHKRGAASAEYDRVAAQYRSTVLLAFKNVADVLHALEFDAVAMQENAKAAHVAGKSFDVSREEFKAGSISYLSLLDAERIDLQSRLGLLQSRADRIADTAALFQALGGGWWNRPDEMKDSLDQSASEDTPVTASAESDSTQ